MTFWQRIIYLLTGRTPLMSALDNLKTAQAAVGTAIGNLSTEISRVDTLAANAVSEAQIQAAADLATGQAQAIDAIITNSQTTVPPTA